MRSLTKSPYTYEFFQAVRILSHLSGDRVKPGGFAPVSTEAVRFSAHQSMTFPASEIQALEFRDSGPPLMVVNFMGLTGPRGVMPLVYTSMVMDRLRQRDPTMRDFFDIFNIKTHNSTLVLNYVVILLLKINVKFM